MLLVQLHEQCRTIPGSIKAMPWLSRTNKDAILSFVGRPAGYLDKTGPVPHLIEYSKLVSVQRNKSLGLADLNSRS